MFAAQVLRHVEEGIQAGGIDADDHIVYTATADTDATSRSVLRTSSHIATTTLPS
jgi:hypothetical protein